MKEYVIRHRNGGFLCKGPNAQWDRTTKFEHAERFPYTKALNVLHNCIGPSMRKYWDVIEAEGQLCPSCGNKENAGEFDWDEISNAQHQLYKTLSQYGEELRARLSEVDLEICDIQHYIEFFSLDAAKGYKAYRMLKDRLERRRTIKDEMAKVNCFLTGSSEDFSSGKIGRQIKGLDNCRYTPRVLNELFGCDLLGRKLPHVS